MIDWGNVPAYIALVLTAAGVAVTTWNTQRGAAARKVWPVPPTREMLESRGLLPPGEHPDNPWVAIRNGSDEPMYDCVLRVLHPDWRTNRRQPIASPGFSCVYPNELSEPFELRGVDVPPFAEGQNGAVPVQVEFRDGHGRRWCRRPDGRLRRGR